MDFVHPISSVIPGAQGRILSVLAETTAELNLTTLARLADVSVAQASRVVPGLVETGLVERHEVPPSSLFRLVRTHVAAQPLLDLAGARLAALRQLGQEAGTLGIEPSSLIVFGSFARGDADGDSDLDVVFVRPLGVDEDDPVWAESVEDWRTAAQAITGNPVEILEVAEGEAPTRLASPTGVWHDIRREGLVLYGASLDELVTGRHG
jgi:hypothetical protein